MFTRVLKYVWSMFEVVWSTGYVFQTFHVFSRVFTCVFSRRAFPNAPAWRAKPSSLRHSARTLTMLTSPRMYSRANHSWTSVYIRANTTRRARSQLCGAIRQTFTVNTTRPPWTRKIWAAVKPRSRPSATSADWYSVCASPWWITCWLLPNRRYFPGPLRCRECARVRVRSPMRK